MTDPQAPPNEGCWWYDGRDLLHKTNGVWRAVLSPHNRDWHDLSEDECRELASALDALDAARKELRGAHEVAEAFQFEREQVKAERDAAIQKWNGWQNRAEELHAALDAADGRTETIRIYEDFLRELGIDTDQPQEAIFEELRRRWDELVVAADPSVMENR